MTIYTVPLIGDGSRTNPFRPAYAELLGSWKRVQKDDSTIAVRSFSVETQEPCDAPGHEELLTKPDVTVQQEV